MESDIQHIQEDEKIVKHLNRHLENIGVWQQINIKDPRKKRGKIGIRKFIQHLIVGLMSGKDSKRAFERDGERKVVEDQTIENILRGIDPHQMMNLLLMISKAVILFFGRSFGIHLQRSRIGGTVMDKRYIE